MITKSGHERIRNKRYIYSVSDEMSHYLFIYWMKVFRLRLFIGNFLLRKFRSKKKKNTGKIFNYNKLKSMYRISCFVKLINAKIAKEIWFLLENKENKILWNTLGILVKQNAITMLIVCSIQRLKQQ